MQQNPLVSIICLCFNHEKFVLDSLQSVINQTYATIELIIVDDCSADNSVEIIKKWLVNFPEIKFIANEKNLGNTKSFNNAVKLAKGDYIIDLAADDVLLPNCVKLQIDKFQNSAFKNIAMVYGNAVNIDENSNFLSHYFEVDADEKVIQKRAVGNIYRSIISSGKVMCSVSSMFKKDVFDKLGGYDETLAYEDLDFWIRLSRNYEVDFIDEILVKKRIVATSMSASFLKQNHKINHSTYKILKKTIGLNRTKAEDLAVQKRVHYEIIKTFKNREFGLLCKNVGLKLWLVWRRLTAPQPSPKERMLRFF